MGRFLLGTLELGLLAVGATALAGRLRARLVPCWRGGHAVLARVVLALGAAVVVLQLLGVVGLLRGWSLALAGVLLLVAGGRDGLRPTAREEPRRAGGPDARSAVAIGLLAGLGAVWVAGVVSVLRHGLLDVDSLAYHLPFAQEWARTHRVGPLVRVCPGTPVPYYPGNAELLHAGTLVAYGRDALGPFLNLGWLGLLVLSGWCLGARRGRSAAVAAAVVIVAGGPLIARFLPGGGMNDVAAIACVLAFTALLVEAADRGALTTGALAVVGVAAGLGIGTKLTVLPFLGAALLGLLALEGVRGRTWWTLVGAAAAPSAFWFLRDLVLTGSPVPFLAVPGLPSPSFSQFVRFHQSVLHYATDRAVLRHAYLPETYRVLGPAWVLLLALLLFGMALGLRSGRSVLAVLAGSSLVAGLVYLVTPTTAGGPEGKPLLFAVDLRYATPTALVGACLAALLWTGRGQRLVEALLVVGAAATLLAPWRLYGTHPQHRAVVVAVALVVGLTVALGVHRREGARRAVAAVAALMLLGLYPVTQRAEDRAYADSASPAPYRFVRGTSGLVVGVTGDLHLSPYAGAVLTNRVVYLGDARADGGFEDYSDCRAWRRAVAAAHPDLLVVNGFARAWVRDRAFVPQLPPTKDEALVLRLAGTPRERTCP
ncbi:MAG: hypothetical protein ACXVFU_10565 [Nocardioidaceae bacterium]